jgi:nucleotide-binding universal stress UspA family protein
VYRRILVPLDGSPFSEVALDQLSHLAGPETEVLLLRVARLNSTELLPGVLTPGPPGGGFVAMVPPTRSSPPGRSRSAEADDRARREAQTYLEEKAEALRGVVAKCRTQVVEDADPAGAIAAEAQDEGADLILMSTHGRSGAVRWILGSVAEKVLHSTHLPLLLVRPGKPSG